MKLKKFQNKYLLILKNIRNNNLYPYLVNIKKI